MTGAPQVTTVKPLSAEELATVLRTLEVAADPFTEKAIPMIRATIAELTKERDAVVEANYELERARLAAEAEVKRLREALKPFADASDAYPIGQHVDNEHVSVTPLGDVVVRVRDLRKARAALTPSPSSIDLVPQTQGGWRAMESAPKDGTRVLLRSNRKDVRGDIIPDRIGRFSLYEPLRNHWLDDHDYSMGGSCWYRAWMPLPAAPEKDGD